MKTLSHHTETTAHLRKLIAAEGIKARVRKWDGKGGIQVFTTAYEISFTEAEQRFIRSAAKANGLTGVRGLEIDVERMTDGHGMVFFTSKESAARWLASARQYPAPHLHRDRQPEAE